MLLAHLQRHTQCLVTQTVNRYTDNTARNVTLVSLAARHISCARTSEAHRATQTLCRAYCNISAPLGGRCQQCQCEDVGLGGNQSTCGVSLCGKSLVVAYGARCCGVLYQCAKLLARELVSGKVVNYEFYAKWLTAGEQYIECLWENILIDEEAIAALLYGIA